MNWQRRNLLSRWVGLAIVMGAALLPTIWLLSGGASLNELSRPFWGSVGRSLKQGVMVLGLSVAIGWPFGTVLALVKIPGRRLLFCLMAIPIFTPAFLWAIGLSSFQGYLAYKWRAWFDGFPGAVWASSAQTLPFVVVGSALSALVLPQSLRDSARMASGVRGLFGQAARYNWPAALGAGLFATIFSLSDPGVSQIMGYHSIATEVLIALGAHYDLHLAATKALVWAALLLPVLMFASWLVFTRLKGAFFGRNPQPGLPINPGLARWFVAAGLLTIAAVVVLPSFSGFFRPLFKGGLAEPIRFVGAAVRQAWPTTFGVALVSASVATILGLIGNLLCRRESAMIRWLVLCSFFLLTLPVSLHALGFARILSILPAWMDPVTRGSSVGLGVCLGLKFVSIPTLLCLYANNQRSAAQDDTARMHGVPAARYGLKVCLPQILPAITASAVIVAMLSVADVAGALTLQPAGQATLATRLFAILDNASERALAVWSLGFVVLGMVGIGALWIGWDGFQRIAGRRPL